MRNRKGFTLIEMLVVIAIVAILVSIAIPLIGKSTTKAAAATNAANLRTMEAQLNIIRLDNSEAFKTTTDQWEQSVVGALVVGVRDILDWLFPDIGTQLAMNGRTITAENGTLTLWDGMTIDNIPGARAITVDGHSIEKNSPMSIVVYEDGTIKAFYGERGSLVSCDLFAKIAETGDVDIESVGSDEGC